VISFNYLPKIVVGCMCLAALSASAQTAKNAEEKIALPSFAVSSTLDRSYPPTTH